jgi:hypothetical protein
MPSPFTSNTAWNPNSEAAVGMAAEAQQVQQTLQQAAAEQEFVLNQQEQLQKQQREAARQAAANERALKQAEAAQKQQIETARRAGVKINTDAYGQESLATHDDGAPLYEAGFQGEPLQGGNGPAVRYRDPRGKQYEVPLPAIRRKTDPAGQAFYEFNLDGQIVRQPEGSKPLFKIDPSTGRRYSEAPDTLTGSFTQTDLGVDPEAYSQAVIAQRQEALQRRQAERGFETDQLRLTQAQQETLLEPKKKRLTEAQTAVKKLEKAPLRYEKRPEGYVMVQKVGNQETEPTAIPTTDTAQLAKAQAWVEQAAKARAELEAARADHDPLAAEVQKLQEQRDKLALATLREKHQAELEIQRMQDAVKKGLGLHEPEWKTRALGVLTDPGTAGIFTQAELEDEGSPLAADVAKARQPAVSWFNRLLEQFNAVADAAGEELVHQKTSLLDGLNTEVARQNTTGAARDAEAAKSLAARTLGIADPENVTVEARPDGSFNLAKEGVKGGDPFANYDPDMGQLFIFNTADEQAREMAMKAAPDGVPVYMLGTGTGVAYTAREMRDLIAAGVNAVAYATTEDERDAALEKAGLSAAQIKQLWLNQRLSVQEARLLNEKFHGIKEVDVSRAGIQGEFQKYLATSPIEAAAMKNGQQADVINRFMDKIGAQAAQGLLLDREVLGRRRQELLQPYAPGMASKAGSFIKETVMPLVGIAGQASMLVSGLDPIMKGLGMKREAGELADRQFADWTKRAAGVFDRMSNDSKARDVMGEFKRWAWTANPGDEVPAELADKIAKTVFEQYHLLNPETGAALNTSADTFNLNKDKMLKAGVQSYLQTGNPAALAQLESLMFLDQRDRDTQAAVMAYIEAPKTATPAQLIQRAKGLGLALDETKAQSLFAMAKQMEGAQSQKGVENILARAQSVMGTTTPEDTRLALALLTRQSTDDPDSAWGLAKGGFVAGRQEVLTEAVFTGAEIGLAALTAGAATPEIMAERAARQAATTGVRKALGRNIRAAFTRLADDTSMFARARQAIGANWKQLGQEFAELGIAKPAFGQPLTKLQKARNLVVNTAKNMAADAPVEALEGGITSLGDPGINAENLASSMLQEAAGGFVLAPLFIGGTTIANAITSRNAAPEWAAQKERMVSAFNDRMKTSPGFRRLTVEDFDAWQGLQSNPAHQAAFREYADALAELAQAEAAQPTTSQRAIPEEPPSPAVLAARAKVDAAAQQMAGLAEEAFRAMDELRQIPADQRPLYTAAAKAASGVRDFTQAEAEALMRQSGANRVAFRQAETLPADVMGPAARKPLKDAPTVQTVAPGVYRVPEGVSIDIPPPLMDMLKERAPTAVQLMTNYRGEQAADSVPVEEAAVQTGATPPAQNPGPQVAADAAAEQAGPANTAAVPLIITRDMRQQLFDRGYSKKAVNRMTPAEAQQILGGQTMSPEPAATTDAGGGGVNAQVLGNIARQTIGAVLGRTPKIKGLVKEVKNPPAYATGGMWINEKDGISFHVPTIAAQLAQIPGLTPQAAAQRVLALLDEEIRHAANLEAAKRLWQTPGLNPMGVDFGTWRDAWYRDIWEHHFTAAMRAKVEEGYGPTLPQEPWLRAMEGLRMLDQLRATGSITEAVLQALDAVLQVLRDFLGMVREGSQPTIQREIDGIRAVLEEYGYEGGALKAGKAKKPVKKAKKPDDPAAPQETLQKQPAISEGELVTYEGYQGRLARDGERLAVKQPDGTLVDVSNPEGLQRLTDPQARQAVQMAEIAALPQPDITEARFTGTIHAGGPAIQDGQGRIYVPQNKRLLRSIRSTPDGLQVLVRRVDQPGRVIRLVGEQAKSAQDAFIESAQQIEVQGGKVNWGANGPASAPLSGWSMVDATTETSGNSAGEMLEWTHEPSIYAGSARLGEQIARLEAQWQKDTGATPANTHIQAGRVGPRADHPGGAQALRFIDAFEKLTGKQVVWINTRPEDGMPFRAATIGDRPNTIFVHARTWGNLLALVGHEWGHTLARQDPELYRGLQKALAQHIARGDGAKMRQTLKRRYRRSIRSEEVTNNIIGDFFTDPEFWREVERINQPLVKDLLASVMAWFDRLLGLLARSEWGTASRLQDVKAARTAVANAFAEALRRGPYSELKVGDDADLVRPSQMPIEQAKAIARNLAPKEAAGKLNPREAADLNRARAVLASAPVPSSAVAPQLNLRYLQPDGQTGANTPADDAKRAASNPLDEGTSLRADGAQRLPAAPAQLLSWAQENGWLIDPEPLASRLLADEEAGGGDEHHVWFDEATQRAVKLTVDMRFVQGSPAAYVRNLRRQNELFDTGYAFEGIVDDEGMPRIVVSQPWVIGRPAEQQAKDDYFDGRGFEPAADDIYYSMDRDLAVTDAKPANVLQREDGAVQPIDVQVRDVTHLQAERYENMVAARGRATLKSAPAQPQPQPDPAKAAKLAQVHEILDGMPAIWREVLTGYWRARKEAPDQSQDQAIQAVARALQLTDMQTGNILRSASGRLNVLLQQNPTKPTVQVENGVVKAKGGRPDLALSGNPVFAAVDQQRMTPEEVTHAEMQEMAGRLFDTDAAAAERLVTRWMDTGGMDTRTEGMPAGIATLMSEAQSRNAGQMLMTAAAKLLVTRESLAGGDTTRLARLIHAYRETGTEQARALNMRQDPHRTPEERAAMYLTEALLTPPPSIRAEIAKNPTNKDVILARWAAQADKIKTGLLAQGIDLDATFQALAEEQKLAADTVPVEVQTPLAQTDGKTRTLVKAVLEGSSWGEAAAAAGLTLEAARKAYLGFRAAINEAAAKAAERAKAEMLASAPAIDYAAQLGLPDWLENASPDYVPVKNEATRKLKQHRERKKKAGEIDLQNRVAVAKVTREIDAAKSTTFDKLSEYWRASILSGPQTAVVNLSSGLIYGTYEATIKKLGAAVVADVARLFGANPDAASLADVPAMVAGVLPSIKAAFGDAIRTWQTETNVFDAYAMQLQNENGGLWKEEFTPALKGMLRKIMHGISFRHMGMADAFVKSFFTRIEVGAQARQIARAEGKRGEAMAQRIAELMALGSMAWERSLAQAKRNTFQNEEVMGPNGPIKLQSPLTAGSRTIDELDRLADMIQRAKKGDFGKALKGVSHFVFPFVATPTNIFKAGVTMSPIGGLLAIIDGVRAIKQHKKGNTEQAAKIYNAARALDDLVNQILAWGVIIGLSDLVKPGEDDDKLPFLTGTMEWRSTSPGERELAYRTAPPQSIRIGNTWYSYKRLDPFASALAFTVDSIKAFQSGKPFDAVWGEVGTNMLRNMQDKTFLQGVSDLMNAVQDPERWGTKWAVNLTTGFIPNLIRQPIRTADPVFRESDLPNDMGFFETLGRKMGYAVVPQMAMPAIDVWGREMTKNTGWGGPNTDWIARLLSPVDSRSIAGADPLDVALSRYNQLHPDAPFGVTAPSRELHRTIGGKEVKLSLEDVEYIDFLKKTGTASRTAIGSRFDGRDLTPDDVEFIKDVISKVRRPYSAAAFVQAFGERGKPD